MNRTAHHQYGAKQIGLSIIELMIALALSSFLILGITQIYIDNKKNYIHQQNQANNQENSRFLVMIVDSYLNKTGYRRAPFQLQEDAFKKIPESTDCEEFQKEASITKAKGGLGICIRYQPLVSQELDCTGQQTPAFDDSKAYSITNNAIVMTLRYKPNANLEGTLECKVGDESAELLKGIADFRMEFAIGTTLDKKVDAIIPADTWTTADGNILQVRYSALMSSGVNQRSSDDSAALDMWKKDASAAEITRLSAADKKYLYQLASSTVAMRNLMP
ncbi:PilW family protein [Pseudomonas sp.]|uniref:PilW family protein n=1 Tax=Pseudomonas sp. TaxID=306 RepID=UPI003C73B517